MRMHGLRAPVVVGDLLLDLLPHLRLLLEDLRNRLLANTLHLLLEQLEVGDALRDAGVGLGLGLLGLGQLRQGQVRTTS